MQAPAPKLMAALDPSALPEAPAPVQPAAVVDDAASQNMVTPQPTTTTKSHKVRPGWIVVGVTGAAAAAMGAYIFSIKTTNTGARDALGTMFLAPGAAAAGLGFYFAFKK
jgi:hypothetical protein